jgi:UDP-GlcNAc:undecaprenyl-phosphate/decaprenyl-phosphate GlcNAc-1-phosphate transferase
MELTILFQFITALFISGLSVYICIPVIVRISEDKNLMDNPNRRKVNQKPVPNLGGVALFIGISIAVLLSLGKMPFIDIRYILVAMIMIFFIGIKDDILIISPRMKFSVEAICALILIFLGNIRFTSLHGILGINALSYSESILLSLVTIVGLINAFNLIDGIDGLASGLGIMMSLIFGAFFFVWEQWGYVIICAAIVGALDAFSIYNIFGHRNKIFMGDTGSLIVGLLISIMAIKFNEFAIGTAIYHAAPALSIAIVFIPLADMARVFVVRVKNRKSPFSADMNHIHHKFLNIGYTHLQASIIIVLINLGVFGIIYSLRDLNNYWLFILLTIFAIALPYIPAQLTAIGYRLKITKNLPKK